MEVKTRKLFTAFLCCIGFFLALSSKCPEAGTYAELNLHSGLCIHLEGLLLGFPNCDPACALSYSVCCVIQQAGEAQALYPNLCARVNLGNTPLHFLNCPYVNN